MLNRNLLTVDHKQAIILMVFSILLIETLTLPTVIFVIICGLLVFLGINPGVLFRHITALGLFIVYWFTYGKLIDPEVGLNFLTSIMVVKLLEKEGLRDRYMIFFGIMLLISSGALFQKSLMYVFFFGLSFYVLIQDFYLELGLPAKFKNLFKLFLWVIPLTAFVFVFIPRMMSPFQIKKGQPEIGEIGYTPDVNISNIESLTGNDRPVFQASMDNPSFSESQLYWRGNTVSSTDGWNWHVSSLDQNVPDFKPEEKIDSQTHLHQKIRLLSAQDYFFALDLPTWLRTPSGMAAFVGGHGFKQSIWQKILRYEVYSLNGDDLFFKMNQHESRLLRNGVRQKENKWIKNNFKENELNSLMAEVQAYFKKEKFSYSLSPGKVDSFSSFMQNKKIGFCSHYASALALILRAKGYQARLVSGFLGGTYNRFGGFYQITQNDAHAWTEVWADGRWKRIDPTDWIAPERIQIGGEAFVQKSSSNRINSINFLRPYLRQFDEAKQWLMQWDYRFYNFLEEMDYEGQRAFLEKYKIDKNLIFSLLPIMLVLFSLLYSVHLLRKQKSKNLNEKLWHEFSRRLKVRGILVEFESIEGIREVLQGKDPFIEEIFNDLIQDTYSSKRILDLKKKIRRL
jgi:hypothetical protein